MRHTRHGLRAFATLGIVCGVLTGALGAGQAAQAAATSHRRRLRLARRFLLGRLPARVELPRRTPPSSSRRRVIYETLVDFSCRLRHDPPGLPSPPSGALTSCHAPRAGSTYHDDAEQRH